MIKPERVSLRPLSRNDAPILEKWLNNPFVLEWYEGRDNPHDQAMVREHFFADEDVTRCIVEYEGEPVGYLQYYPVEAEEREEYGLSSEESVYGLDQFVGEPALWGSGIGRVFVSLALDIIRELGGGKAVLDPHADNERAIRCYQACGFRKVKLLPCHELHEGVMRDCWLMAVTLL